MGCREVSWNETAAMPSTIGHPLGVRRWRRCTQVPTVAAFACVCLVRLHASQQLDPAFAHTPVATTSAPKMFSVSALSQPLSKPIASAMNTPKAAASSSGYVWATVATAIGFAAILSQGRDTNFKGNSLVGGNCKVINIGDKLSAPHVDLEGKEPPRVIMYGKSPRTHVPYSKRKSLDRERHHRRNSAAKVRFLFKPDGTIWRKQAGLRHLKSKKKKDKLKRLSKMVQIAPGERRKIWILTGKKYRPPKPDELIMRKFNEKLLKTGDGKSDRGWGTAL